MMPDRTSYDEHMARYYGNLARVAIQFYVTTGNPIERQAAYVYARQAFHFANGGDSHV